MAFAGGFWRGIATQMLSVITGSVLLLPLASSLALAEHCSAQLAEAQ